jgi:ABC-type transport system substrate-binding protein
MISSRRLVPLLAVSLLCAGFGFLAGPGFSGTGQPPPGGKTTGKKPRPPEEEEEAGKTRPKVPLRVDDDPSPATEQPLLMAALQTQADKAKPGPVLDLYRRLAVAHDELRFTTARPVLWIVPLPAVVTVKGALEEPLEVREVDNRGRPTGTLQPARKEVAGVDPYEAVALAAVERFLDEAAKTAPAAPAAERWQHAETVLAEVLRFHGSAREQRRRVGPGWDDLEKQLRDRLRTVRLKRLEAVARGEGGKAADDLADLLVETYPEQKDVRTAVLRTRAGQLERLLPADTPQAYTEVRKGLDRLEQQFPHSADEPAVAKLQAALQAKAGELLKRVAEFAVSDPVRAKDHFLLAERVWPQAPELAKWRSQLNVSQPLYVGVNRLPESMSPLSATSDAERLALDLLFESLIAPEPDLRAGQTYLPGLSPGNPLVAPSAREFRLVPDARWYGLLGKGKGTVDEPVTAYDVLATVSAYQRDWLPHDPEWADLTAEARDPHRLTLGLKQGAFDPLALMSFKVLPAKYLRDPSFDQHPIGSGPYYYNGRARDPLSRLEYAEFLANPTYGGREGKANLPAFREIRMVKGADFRTGRLHLMVGLNRQQLREVQSRDAGLDAVKILPLPSRRVQFLAVNHRHLPLQNVDLRRAIAFAINRDKVLDECFRTESGKFHQALNGPFPVGSWPCNDKEQEVPSRLPLDKAKFLAGRAKTAGLKLTLKYPADQPDVEEACNEIANMVKDQTGVEIQPVAVPAGELRDAVEKYHNFELAYCSWDYPDNSFSLAPLFAAAPEGAPGPNAPAYRTRNILGPVNDPDLDALFGKLRTRRQFGEVRRIQQAIHRQIYDKMPLIPLWQLDTLIAVHANLITVPEPDRLDAQHLFRHADAWRWSSR